MREGGLVGRGGYRNIMQENDVVAEAAAEAEAAEVADGAEPT